MRTLIDIPNHQLEELKELMRQQRRSRAALVRAAISRYLESERASAKDPAFGMLAGRSIDGLDFERRMRQEWERES